MKGGNPAFTLTLPCTPSVAYTIAVPFQIQRFSVQWSEKFANPRIIPCFILNLTERWTSRNNLDAPQFCPYTGSSLLSHVDTHIHIHIYSMSTVYISVSSARQKELEWWRTKNERTKTGSIWDMIVRPCAFLFFLSIFHFGWWIVLVIGGFLRWYFDKLYPISVYGVIFAV